MEATNILIKQSSNVSINIETLQAIKQRVLQAVKQTRNKRVNIGAWTLPRLYRKELRLTRAIAKAMDAQSALVNGVMTAMVVWFIYYVFMYY